MTDTPVAATHGHHEVPTHEDEHLHVSRRGYLTGFALSVVLTAIPFWVVMAGALSPNWTVAVVVAAAVAQIVVHTIYFLHVSSQSEGGWTLMAYVFAAVIVLIVIAGSLWIMYHLNTNMMPMSGMDGTP
ncbi:hypothetical protein ASE86_15310 [Sphingomonas sp. Leaf33]|uniref:cytochrome o ubiquinol oxidase subunit IV n=1 Tax=Sphingomonas sp. Leaf33 TaxID=1736215 RepID=UPI0006F2CE1A|nr:cytochrome o ubiquinol oxidase subunit IV [Sphingomonas sp. Leaf33]KQN20617.1 hypothetical protein ASE86_15310 [Sphingomonas sp. Leaf33]